MPGGCDEIFNRQKELPYDAMVSDPSQLCPVEEEGDDTDDEKTEEIQTDTVHGEGQSLR